MSIYNREDECPLSTRPSLSLNGALALVFADLPYPARAVDEFAVGISAAQEATAGIDSSARIRAARGQCSEP